jgi:hypothetical protein
MRIAGPIGIATMLGYRTWAVCGFRVVFLEDYNSTTSALSSYSFFDQGIEVTEAIHDEIKNNPTLKARLQSALKAGGLEALKAIFNHPFFNIPAETIKGFIEAE